MKISNGPDDKRPIRWLSIFLLLSLTLACNFSTPTPNVPRGATQMPIESNTPIPRNNTTDINFVLFNISSGTSVNGWTPYSAQIAIRNKGTKSIYLHFVSENYDSTTYNGDFSPNLHMFHVYSSSSYVKTSEGNQYPVDMPHFEHVIIIPGGFTISGFTTSYGLSRDQFSYNFEVPELLHPVQLVISPGIALEENGETHEVIIDITQDQELQPTLGNIQNEYLPVDIPLNEKVNLTIESPVDFYRSWDQAFSLSIPFFAQNMDITGNQTIEIEYFIIDDLGMIIKRDSVFGNGIPYTIGPGQTITKNITFSIPPYSAFENRKLYLKVINNNIDKTYILKVPSLPNCVPVPAVVPNIIIYGITKNINLPIPGSISDNIGGEETHLLQFDRSFGKIIRFKIESVSENRLSYYLIDPEGYAILSGDSWYGGDIGGGDSSYVPIICNGTYNLYVTSTDALSYKVTTSVIETP